MEDAITLKIDSYEFADEHEAADLAIIGGDFIEGEMVTVSICGKEFTRRVKHSAKKYGDLYITINGYDFTYSEFYNPAEYWDIDYKSLIEKKGR